MKDSYLDSLFSLSAEIILACTLYEQRLNNDKVITDVHDLNYLRDRIRFFLENNPGSRPVGINFANISTGNNPALKQIAPEELNQ